MELLLCPAKSSGSTNRVGNTFRSEMVWTLSPFFFHVESETAHDVAESYAYERVGTIMGHPFEGRKIF